MKPHCEKFVLNVLPGIRAMLVRDLMNRHGVTQTRAAALTGVTQAAVSQYMRSIRGRRITKNKSVEIEIRKISDALVQKKMTKADLNNRFCIICKIINQAK